MHNMELQGFKPNTFSGKQKFHYTVFFIHTVIDVSKLKIMHVEAEACRKHQECGT